MNLLENNDPSRSWVEVVTVNGLSGGALAFVNIPTMGMLELTKLLLEIAVLVTVLVYNAIKLKRYLITKQSQSIEIPVENLNE